MTENNLMFQPLQIGTLTLNNRVIMTPVKLGYGNLKGEVTERHIAFYARRAQGNIGLLTTEPMYIHLNGRELPTQLGIHSDELLEGLQQMTNAVHAAGGRIMAHINHAGRAANPNLVGPKDLVSASDVLCPANQVTPRPLTGEEITAVVASFADAARRAREAGFDAIEIPFSHGYLIHQFLSPHTNRRDDAYGGSSGNRLRFGLEVIAATRELAGPDFPLVVRMNAQDYVEGGLTIDDALALAPELEKAGVSALSVSSGTMCETVPFSLYPTGTPKANLLPMAARIRETVTLPVIVAGRIRTPQIARDALDAGQADLIGLGRPFLSDPDWVIKAESGDAEGIMLCAACHQGCLAELRKGHGTACAFNPFTGREAQVEIVPTSDPRQVMVVGGGPAGLEAATIAAQRGHHVTLYEQSKRLGGQFVLAAKAPHKEEFNDIIASMELMARRAGVTIQLETHVTPEMARDSGDDVIVLATGGIPLTIPFPGLEETRWLLASDILDGHAEVDTGSVLMIGGGLVGLETADFLAAGGTQVTLVEMLDDVGGDMDILAKNMLMKRLKANGVTLLPGTKILSLSKDSAVAQQGDQEIRLPIETIVIAVGLRANRELLEALAGSDLEIHTIGDAVEPRKVLEAIWEGFEIGQAI